MSRTQIAPARRRARAAGALVLLGVLATLAPAQPAAPGPAAPDATAPASAPLPAPDAQPPQAEGLAPIPPRSFYVPPAPRPGQLSDRVVSYTIDARLDPDAKTVAGKERVTWRNPSDVAVDELRLHLYLNAFRDASSTFMKESGGQLRGDRFADGAFGGVDVTAMRTSAGDDLLPGLDFVHPDDDNADDRTVARVPLPRPVGPGETLEFDVEFTSKMPQVFARTGYFEDFYLVGQWFPKLGVFEPRGMRGRQEPGWNCHQFHANSEFYADFGVFDVRVTTPSDFVVGATGVLVDTATNADGTTTRHYHQEDVHDFAFTADRTMLVGTRTVERPGRAPLLVTALVQPEHAETLDRHLDDAVASVAWFERNVGEYPYATLTVVDPPVGANGAGGMEYPTFITAGEVGSNPHPDDAGLEVVIFHEFGHQFWYGMVASNEFEEPWMDEGINSYSESLGLDEMWSDRNSIYVSAAPLSIKLPIPSPYFRGAQRFAALPRFVEPDPIVRTSWGFASNLSYGLNCYPRTALTLRTLRAYLGAETMDRVMRTYFERWKFRHPTAQDFFDVANEISGQDLTWFFDEFFRSSRPLDYAVGTVERSDSGWRVTLERRGEAVFPVKARVTRENGRAEDLAWDGRETSKTFDLDASSPVARVEIDPDHVVSLDADVTNNSRVASAELVGPFRVASDWGLFFEHVLALLGGCV